MDFRLVFTAIIVISGTNGFFMKRTNEAAFSGSCELIRELKINSTKITDINHGQGTSVLVSGSDGIERYDSFGGTREDLKDPKGKKVWSAIGTNDGSTWVIPSGRRYLYRKGSDAWSGIIQNVMSNPAMLRIGGAGVWQDWQKELEAEILSPFRLDVDREGRLVVLDMAGPVVHWIRTTSPPIIEMTTRLDQVAQWGKIWEIAVTLSGDLAIVDKTHHCIRIVSKEGKLVSKAGVCGDAGSGPGYLNSPNDITVDAAGRLLVSDTKGDRISVFDVLGEHLGDLCAGLVEWPRVILVTKDWNLWVEDAWDIKVFKFML